MTGSPGRPEIGPAFSLRFPADLLAAVDAAARTDGISRAELIRRVVSAHLTPERPPADYVPYGDRRPYVVADSFARLVGPTTGTIVLDPRLNWSGNATYDLDDPRRLASMYVTVITEATTVEDLDRWLDRDRLVGLWPVLNLPLRVRRLWEERFTELRTRPGRRAA